jgi:tetratricopeptide (TPR) repeat protein
MWDQEARMTHKKRIFATALAVGLMATATATVGDQARAFDSSGPEDEADSQFRKAEKAIKAKKYDEAIPLLQAVLKSTPKNADALNELAYSQRNLGRLDEAMTNYNAALAINPEHKGALEYQGELFLMQGNSVAAEANLEKLNQICKRGCAEKAALSAAVERFKNAKAAAPDASPRTYSMGY